MWGLGSGGVWNLGFGGVWGLGSGGVWGLGSGGVWGLGSGGVWGLVGSGVWAGHDLFHSASRRIDWRDVWLALTGEVVQIQAVSVSRDVTDQSGFCGVI